MENIERNKQKIADISAYALSLSDKTETEMLLRAALEDMVAMAHALNNSLANTQMYSDEVEKHAEELQEQLNKVHY